MQKEELARRWCSKENKGIELAKDLVWFWDEDHKMYLFEFDITSHPNRKEIEEVNSRIKQYENMHGKITDYRTNPYFKELVGLYCKTPGKTDKREILGMVKSSKLGKSGTSYASILGDCFLLRQARADKKYMFLTDKKMYDYFLGRCKPILGEIQLVYLDPEVHSGLLNGPNETG
jgi:hypothetical protein